MSKTYEISCSHCGGDISLNEELDRNSDAAPYGDWVEQTCDMCGGVMTVYRRWVDPPQSHGECSENGWHAEPCDKCFGPMTVLSDTGERQTSHPRCAPEFWYERSCEVCKVPLPIHVDWDEPPTTHRNCEVVYWYEKDCIYCDSSLKVHVDWDTVPDAHEACKPSPVSEALFEEMPVEPCVAEKCADVDAVGTNGNGYGPKGFSLVPENSHGSVVTETEPDDGSAEEADIDRDLCSECGDRFVRLGGKQSDVLGLCRNCRQDAFLLSGAISAMRNQFPVCLTITNERKTRVVTEKIAVVKNTETDEVVAEIKLCNDGIFTVERAAVAYDPLTDEKFSKTVFGHKGFFSALHTAETFDSSGNLLQHTRGGTELAVAVDKVENEFRPTQITKNRFVLKHN